MLKLLARVNTRERVTNVIYVAKIKFLPLKSVISAVVH